MMITSDRYIARLNVERFRKLLGTEVDDTKRQTILSLLTHEEAVLSALDKFACKAEEYCALHSCSSL
jgi:hypothetical protein